MGFDAVSTDLHSRPRFAQSASVNANGFERPPTNGKGNELSLMKMKPSPSPRPNNMGSDSFNPPAASSVPVATVSQCCADEGLETRYFNSRHESRTRQRLRWDAGVAHEAHEDAIRIDVEVFDGASGRAVATRDGIFIAGIEAAQVLPARR